MPYFVTMPAKEGGYWIRFDYDPELVQRIKQLPPDARRWNPEMRAWWVHPLWFETAKKLLNDMATYSDYRRCQTGQNPDDPREEYERTRRAEEQERAREQERERQQKRERQFDDWFNRTFRDGSYGQNQSTRNRATSSCFATLYLLPDAPPKVVTAAWKALCLIHHPDVGGSTERMKEINLAYEEAIRIAERQTPK